MYIYQIHVETNVHLSETCGNKCTSIRNMYKQMYIYQIHVETNVHLSDTYKNKCTSIRYM